MDGALNGWADAHRDGRQLSATVAADFGIPEENSSSGILSSLQ